MGTERIITVSQGSQSGRDGQVNKYTQGGYVSVSRKHTCGAGRLYSLLREEMRKVTRRSREVTWEWVLKK